MDDRAQTIRRRIALYNRYIAVGVDASAVRLYRYLITVNEAELAEIEGRVSSPECQERESPDKG